MIPLDPARAAALEAYRASGEAERRVAPEDHPAHLRGPAVPYGLGFCDDVLCGVGPGYTVRFDGAGFELRQRGERADASRSVSFSLEEIRRGDRVVYTELGDTPRAVQEGFLASVELTPTIDARFEVGAQGVEQTYLLHELPGESGDLVVRGRLETDLERRVTPAEVEQVEGLVFESAPVQGERFRLRYGGVTGIDALGRRVRGTISLQDDVLELRLPAAFLAQAVAPILLDPLVGPMDQSLPTGPYYQPEQPAVAFDETNDRYLAVWVEPASPNTGNIYGQFRSSSGLAIGGLIPIVFGEYQAGWPELANVNATDKFLMVYRRGGLHARTIDAASGTVSSRVEITPYGGYVDHDVAGEQLPPYDRALVAYIENSSVASPSHVSYRLVTCPSSGPPVVGSVKHVPGGIQLVSRVCVSKSGGTPGNWILGWRQYNGVPARDDIMGSLIRYDGAQTNTKVLIEDATPSSVPSVAGDGTHFAVASGSYTGLHARSFYGSVSSTGLQPWGPLTTIQAGNYSGSRAQLERVGGYYVLVWGRYIPLPGPDTSRLEGCKLWVSSCSPAEPVYTMSERVNGEVHHSWRIFGESVATAGSGTPRNAMLISSTRLGGLGYNVLLSLLGT